MIVSIGVNRSPENDLKLKVVATEKEAFFEMCQYLKVNNIRSDITTIETALVAGKDGSREPVKVVRMKSSAVTDSTLFTIRKETEPVYDSIEEMTLNNEYFSYCYEEYKKGSPGFNLLSSTREGERGGVVKAWLPDEYALYVKDLEKREGEQCP